LISHHLSETTIAAYATGALPEGLAIVAATHIAQCSACQETLAMLEAAGGALLDEMPPVALTSDALDRLMARTDEPPQAAPPMLNSWLPAPLDRVELGRWWPIGLGVRYRPLRMAGAAWCGLILAQPGRALRRHGHDGLELTCILSGSFTDASGIYQAGDLSEPADEHDDPPRVFGAEPCLCVIASEGMQLRGLLGAAQRLLGL
jgi:putative transcriptional regulator